MRLILKQAATTCGAYRSSSTETKLLANWQVITASWHASFYPELLLLFAQQVIAADAIAEPEF